MQIRELQNRELQGLPVPIHGLIILTKFDEDWAKIVDLLLLV